MAAYQDAHLEQLMKDLLHGFHTLHREFQLLREQKQALEDKLSFASGQFRVLEEKYARGVDGEFIAARAACRWDKEESHTQGELEDAISKGAQAADIISNMMGFDLATSRTSPPLKTGDTPSETVLDSQRSNTMDRIGSLEKDFTTPGTPSQLQCPFANTGNPSPHGDKRPQYLIPDIRRPPTPPDTKDHIESIQKDDASRRLQPSNSSFSEAASCTSNNKCPIRFLGHQAPEEIAEYFEKHKHELPRSHAVCVKRFQSNAESVRQLDAKYGNLVSMIQALGQKHKSYLPETPRGEEEPEEEQDDVPPPTDRVEKWASNITPTEEGFDAEEEEAAPAALDEEEREPRFDRPLREVRVGESPSRPWGISVPIEYEEPHAHPSPVRTQSAVTPLADVKTARPAGKCPFGHGAPAEDVTIKVESRSLSSVSVRGSSASIAKPAESLRGARSVTPQPAPAMSAAQPAAATAPNFITPSPGQPQMLFTGPVFIGYPIEQAIQLLQQTSLGTPGK